MPNFLPEHKVMQLRNLFSFGRTLRIAAKQAGISNVTALRYFRQFRAEGVHRQRCGCGQFGGHKGWCWWRFKQSSRRQSYMAEQGHYNGPIKKGLYDLPFRSRMDRKTKEMKAWEEARNKLREVKSFLSQKARESRTRAS